MNCQEVCAMSADENAAPTTKNRRHFLWVLAGGSIGWLLRDGADLEKSYDSYAKMWVRLAAAKRDLLDRRGRDFGPRLTLLARLLRLSGNVRILAPSKHPLYRRPGGHDVAAMAVVSSMLNT